MPWGAAHVRTGCPVVDREWLAVDDPLMAVSEIAVKLLTKEVT